MFRKFSFLLLAFLLAGCAAVPAKSAAELAIYLPVERMSGRDILAADLSKLALEAQPLISADEIGSYTAASHDLRLTPAAVERLAAMKIPVNGIGFVACLGTPPIFAGAIWTQLSSLSFDGVTIQVPIDANDTLVHLYSGYPSMDEPLPDDPRNDACMLKALEQAGKLR